MLLPALTFLHPSPTPFPEQVNLTATLLTFV
jgi:hypothetical protein